MAQHHRAVSDRIPSEAMADLVAILDARSSDYAQAEAELDTSGRTVEQSGGDLLKLVQEWT